MAIISINGRAGSGKDTIGKIIQYLTTVDIPDSQEYIWRHVKQNQNIENPVWQIKKYSDKLKDMTCILIGCTREQLEDQNFKATPLDEKWNKQEEIEDAFKLEYKTIETTPRDILQKLGTDFGRDMLHPDIWINALFADYHSGIKMSDYTESKWIITDSRFPNDVERVKSLGGICIRVNRKSKILPCVAHEYQHPSEIALDNYEGFDYIIDNNGTIEKLIEKVKKILIKENIINERQ